MWRAISGLAGEDMWDIHVGYPEQYVGYPCGISWGLVSLSSSSMGLPLHRDMRGEIAGIICTELPVSAGKGWGGGRGGAGMEKELD